MAVDITTIPDEELVEDRRESLRDIDLCSAALAVGVTTYGDGQSVRGRLDINRVIVQKIDDELKRRSTTWTGGQDEGDAA